MDEEQGWVPAAYLESEDGSADEFANQPVKEREFTFFLNSSSFCIPFYTIF